MECYILAGGESRRFGEDKLLFNLRGKPAVQYVVDAVLEVGLIPYVVTKDPSKFSSLQGAGVLGDSLSFQSPLAGLYTAMEHCNGDKFLLLGGDMPLVKPRAIKLLIDSYESPITIVSIKTKLYPTFCIYSTSLMERLEEYIERGFKSVVGFIRKVGYKEVIEEDMATVDPSLESVINMNTKEDAFKVLKYLQNRYES